MAEENAFLRDQVLRLNTALARSQKRPALVEEGGEAAPWLANAEQLPPLLAAYDSRVSELEVGESGQRARAERAEALLRERDATVAALKSELAHALETALRHEAASGAMMKETGGRVAGAAVADLEQRLEVLYQENNVLTEQSREMADELERLRAEKLEQAQNHVALVKQVGLVREEQAAAEARGRRAAEARNSSQTELQRCVSELMVAQEHAAQAMAVAERHAAERDAAMTSLADYRATLEALNGRAHSDRDALQTDLDAARRAERDALDRLGRLEAELQETHGREQQAMTHLAAMRADAQSATEAIRALEGRCTSAEAHAAQRDSEGRDLHARLDEASLEKERLSAAHQRMQAEASRAEERARRAEASSKRDVEECAAAMRREAASRGALLQDELRDSEQTIADLRHKLARHERRREPGARYGGAGGDGGGGGAVGGGAALSAAMPTPNSVFHGVRVRVEGMEAMEEMALRLGSAERERDQLTQQQRVTSASLRAQTEAQSQERSAAAERAEGLQRQVRRLEDELSEARGQVSKLQAGRIELEQTSSTAQSELVSLRHEHAEAARMHRQELDGQTTALKRQLGDARDQHERASAEVEQLLASQEQLSAQYRTEARGIAERSEALVQELRAETERLTVRNAELSGQVAASIAQANQASGSERDEAAKVVSLQAQLTQAVEARQQLQQQHSQLRAQLAGVEAERKTLQRGARVAAASSTATSSATTATATATKAAAAATAEDGARRVARKKEVRTPTEAAAQSAAAEVAGALAEARLQTREAPPPAPAPAAPTASPHRAAPAVPGSAARATAAAPMTSLGGAPPIGGARQGRQLPPVAAKK